MCIKRTLLALVGLVSVAGGSATADLLTTADVRVDFPSGEFVPLEIGTPIALWDTRNTWGSFPALLSEQPYNFFQVGVESGLVFSGKVTFEVLTDGAVLLATSNLWGGGGNSSGGPPGGWIPELISYDDFIAVSIHGIQKNWYWRF
jgi:hypothetical protein